MTQNKGTDLRGWVALGLFGLTGYILHLLATNPKLADSQLFAALAGAIVVSGLIGGVVAYLYGSSKGSDDKTALLARAPAQPPPAPTAAPAPQPEGPSE